MFNFNWGIAAYDVVFVQDADKFSVTYLGSFGDDLRYAEIDRSTLGVIDWIKINDDLHPCPNPAELSVVPGTTTIWTAFVYGTNFVYMDEHTLPQSAPPVEPVMPEFLRLRAHPNPFNATTVFSFIVENPSEIWIDVYDVLGRQVAELGRAFYPSGQYEVSWGAGGLPSGLYVAVLRTEDGIAASTKVTLLK